MKQTKQIDSLTNKEERDLVKRIKLGDIIALEKLTKANIHFVVSIAKQKKYQNQGLSLAELIARGNLGLIRAAQSFDETQHLKFILYAESCIHQYINEALQNIEIQNLFGQNMGIMTTDSLLSNNISNYTIQKLLETNLLERVKTGWYRWWTGNELEIIQVSKLVSEGVFCLFTAWTYYELSNFVSPNYHLAIPKSKKIKLPEYPPIQLYYWDNHSYDIGITTAEIEGAKVQIYDIEKSVCDAVKFRNKQGMDIAKEVVKNYLKRPDRDIVKLQRYAEQLRVTHQISNFLEILL